MCVKFRQMIGEQRWIQNFTALNSHESQGSELQNANAADRSTTTVVREMLAGNFKKVV